MSLKANADGFLVYEAGFGLIDGIDDDEHRALLLSMCIHDDGHRTWAILPLKAIMHIPAERIVHCKEQR